MYIYIYDWLRISKSERRWIIFTTPVEEMSQRTNKYINKIYELVM